MDRVTSSSLFRQGATELLEPMLHHNDPRTCGHNGLGDDNATGGAIHIPRCTH